MLKYDKESILRLKQLPRQGAEPELGDLLGAYSDGIKVATSDANVFMAGLGKLTATIKEQGDAFIKLVNAQNFYQQANAGLQKSFGLNTGQAAEMGEALDGLAKSMGVGGMKLRAYQTSLKGLVGSYASVTDKINGSLKPLLAAQTVIQTNLKLSDQQANKFIQYAAGLGKDADTQLIQYGAIADQLSAQTGMQVTLQELVGDITSATADLQIQYGKIPEKLALANLKAKALGLSMADLNKTGQSFLNIESAIGDELEYQLLSGNRLIGNQQASAELQGKSLTNAYRTATIQGDMDDQANIMNQILEQEGETLEKNMFARQQMAKLLGMDEATLSRTLQQQKLLSSIGAEKLLNANAAEVTKELANNPAFQALDDDQKKDFLDKLKKSQDARTPDERAADALDMIVSEGITLSSKAGAGDMRKLVEQQDADLQKSLAKFLEVGSGIIGNKTNREITGKAVTAIQGGMDAGQMVIAFKEALSTTQYTNPWVVNAKSATINTDGVDGDDVAMGPGSGRTIFGPEGAINLNSKDSIIAGTDLFGQGTGGGGSDVATLAAAVVSAINRQTDELTRNSQMNGQYWT